jgi:hypothetical protein
MTVAVEGVEQADRRNRVIGGGDDTGGGGVTEPTVNVRYPEVLTLWLDAS